MNFKEFKEKYFGKSVEEIKKGLMKEENFWKKNNDIISICLDIDKLIEQIITIKKEHPSVFLLQKKMLILRYIFENFTTLESIPENDMAEDYDFIIEEVIFSLSSEARFVNQMVNNGLNELHNIVLENLYEIFNEKTPSTEDIEKMATQLENMFKDESPEKLELIKNILDFNDPTLKEVRDNIYENKTLNKIELDVKNRQLELKK